MKALAAVAASVLLALSVLHVIWAVRGQSSGVAIPTRADGTPLFLPGRVSTLLVAFALAIAAALVLTRAYGPPQSLWARWIKFGTWAVAAAFALRSVGEFRYVGLFKRQRSTLFAKWDTFVFTPLCIALAIAVAVVAATEPPETAPAELMGEFRDDYGNEFRITDSEFVQLPRSRFRIVEWNVAEQYLIAQNDSLNATDAGLWTRIDWMPFTGMLPYTWGFCLTAWRAATAGEARAATPANREAPRTGCNGHPFSRMRYLRQIL